MLNQPVDVHFAGKSLEWGISTPFDVGCEIDGAKRPQAGDGGEWRKCAGRGTLPDRFAKSQAKVVARTADVAFAFGSDFITLRSVEVTADPCIDITYDKQSCIGPGLQLDMSGKYLNPATVSADDLKCEFLFNGNILQTSKATWDDVGQKASCSTPAEWGEERYDTFHLRDSNNEPYLRRPAERSCMKAVL